MKTYAEKNWGSRSDVIAYSLNFVQISYLKHEAEHYFEMDCQKCGHLGRQKADLTSSKSEMSKKDYELKVKAYEEAYNKKLDYTFDYSDIAGLKK